MKIAKPPLDFRLTVLGGTKQLGRLVEIVLDLLAPAFEISHHGLSRDEKDHGDQQRKISDLINQVHQRVAGFASPGGHCSSGD